MPASELSPELRQQVYVIVPAYNEAGCIESVLRDICAVYPNVVVIDDGSQDDTFYRARRVAPHVLRHVINRGQGAALRTGIEFALRHGAAYVVTFDADGQHLVDDITALLAPIVAGECEITLGSRFLGEAIRIPLTRRIMLKCAVLFTRVVSRIRVTDTHNGLRGFSRRAAQRMDIEMDRMAHASEIIDLVRRSGLPYREVPVRIHYTEYSLAKGQGLGEAFRVMWHYLIGRVVK